MSKNKQRKVRVGRMSHAAQLIVFGLKQARHLVGFADHPATIKPKADAIAKQIDPSIDINKARRELREGKRMSRDWN